MVKRCANMKRSFQEFEVGDKVFKKVTPQRYRLKLEESTKLSPTFLWSFDIVKWIGPVACKLQCQMIGSNIKVSI